MSDVLVLCYHAVSLRWPADLSVTPKAFERQLRLLKRAGYHGATFTEAVTQRPRRRTVCVTFDDAYRSVLTLAAPALRALGWPATVYVPTDHMGTERPMVWPGIEQWLGTEHEPELLPLDRDELRGLLGEGWEIGSHTCSHPRLTELGDEQLAAELRGSREILRDEFAIECDSIAYPYGNVDARVVTAARNAGYRSGASLPARWTPEEPLDHPRVGVWHGEPLWRAAFKGAWPTRRLRGLLGR